MRNLVQKWPGCKLIHSKPRYPQSQGSVERSNACVTTKLNNWLAESAENKEKGWAYGLKFVQFTLNSLVHSRLGHAPCKAVFGMDPRRGLFSSNIPARLIENINTEEELEQYYLSRTSFSMNDPANHCGQSLGNSEETTGTTPVEQEEEDPVLSTINMCDLNDDSFEIGRCRVCNKNLGPHAAQCRACEYAMHQTCSTNNVCHACTPDEEHAVCAQCGEDLPPSMIHKCAKCSCSVHKNCSKLDLCLRCDLESQRKNVKQAFSIAHKINGDKMLGDSVKKQPNVSVGDNVRVPIPIVDREPLGPSHIIGLVQGVNEHGQFTIGTHDGVLQGSFCRSQFEKLQHRHFVSNEDIPDRILTVRAANGGKYCYCNGGCKDNRCRCRKANILCSSRCHHSNSCNNK